MDGRGLAAWAGPAVGQGGIQVTLCWEVENGLGDGLASHHQHQTPAASCLKGNRSEDKYRLPEKKSRDIGYDSNF